MAKKEDVLLAMELIHESRPKEIFNEFNKLNFGILAVMKYLQDAEEVDKEVNSVDISKFLGISSARMTVLLKKLEKQGMVIKTNSKNDARAKIIQLSEEGRERATFYKEKAYKIAEKIVDEFGMEEFIKLMENLNKFKKIMDEDRESIIKDLGYNSCELSEELTND